MSKNIDLKMVYKFTNKYENLKEEGVISEQDFKNILSLLDQLEQIESDKLDQLLKDIT
ncbi:MAG: hypothetical protein K9K32_01480 [Halanaerobiales bacterium]|nr:hypothetical protein [Halanaerobiales bacterium]